MADSVVELLPRQSTVLGDYNLFQLLLAKGAIFVVHKQAYSKTTLGANGGVAAGAECEESDLVEAEDATFFVGCGDLLFAHFAVNAGSGLYHICLFAFFVN